MSESGTGNPGGSLGENWDKPNKDIWDRWEREIREQRRTQQKKKDVVGRYKYPDGTKSINWNDQTPTQAELNFGMDLSAVASELVFLLESKQKDYGPRSVNGAPGGPINGLLVRLHDKFSRAGNLVAKKSTPNNETLRETFIDIAGYALLAIMVIDGTFPKE